MTGRMHKLQCGLIAVETVFGWTLSGPVPVKVKQSNVALNISMFNTPTHIRFETSTAWKRSSGKFVRKEMRECDQLGSWRNGPRQVVTADISTQRTPSHSYASTRWEGPSWRNRALGKKPHSEIQPNKEEMVKEEKKKSTTIAVLQPDVSSNHVKDRAAAWMRKCSKKTEAVGSHVKSKNVPDPVKPERRHEIIPEVKDYHQKPERRHEICTDIPDHQKPERWHELNPEKVKRTRSGHEVKVPSRYGQWIN